MVRLSILNVMRNILTICLLMALGTGCGSKNRLQGFAETVKSKVSATDFSNWATNALASGNTSEIGTSGPLHDLIHAAEYTRVIEDGHSHERIALICYGGGFGHWGVAVGSSNYSCHLGNYRVPWTNGIWFWSE